MEKSIVFIIMNLALFFCLNAQSVVKADSVEIIEDYNNLYYHQNFYLGGQPTLEELQWLKSKNVNTIINLRADKENKKFSETAYNEHVVAQDLGFEYNSLPIEGPVDFTPENLEMFLNLLKDNNKSVFVHCQSGVRVTYFYMAYLIKIKGYSINDAVRVGESLKYSSLLEKLLGTEITMEEFKQ